DGPGPVAGEGEVLVLVRPKLDVVGAQALARHLHPPLAVEGGLDGGPVGLYQSLLDLVDSRSQPGPESSEVGDDRPGDELGQAGDVLELLDVQFLPHLLADAVVERRTGGNDEEGPLER